MSKEITEEWHDDCPEYPPDYIVEIKWTEDVSKQADLSIFDGKIKNKGQSTRGFFLSINGFDKNSVFKFSGDAPRIILMDGQDFYLILEEITTFYDLMKLKTDSLARKGNIYVNYGNS
jgi:restriction endonuclease Mrr